MPLIQIMKNDKNEEKKIFYSQIPKTGGTSIIKFFYDNFRTNIFYFRESKICDAFIFPTQHMHANIFNEVINFEKLTYAFTIVRHPIDRIISEYYHANKNNNKPDNINDWFNKIYIKLLQNPSINENHFRKQIDFVNDKIKVFKFEDCINKIIKLILKDNNLLIENHYDIDHLRNRNEIIKKNVNLEKNIKFNLETTKTIFNYYEDDFISFKYDY